MRATSAKHKAIWHVTTWRAYWSSQTALSDSPNLWQITRRAVGSDASLWTLPIIGD